MQLPLIFSVISLFKFTLGSQIISTRHTHPFIIGGEQGDIVDTPWQVALFIGKRHSPLCGGSIVSEKYILTAAHCVYGLKRKASDFSIIYGTKEPGAISGNNKKINVYRVHIHPEYQPNNESKMDNDVAILELLKRIKFSPSAKPVALTSKEPETGEEALVTGWGVTEIDNPIPSRFLLKAPVIIIDRAVCSRSYEGLGLGLRVTKGMFCAASGGKDACQGDSGGPITVNGIQIGIVSWGWGCADPAFPGVYTNIHKYHDFINSVTNNTVKWSPVT